MKTKLTIEEKRKRHAAYMRGYYARTKARWSELAKQRRLRNLDEARAKARAYAERNPDKIRAQSKLYRERNPEHVCALRRASYRRNKARHLATCTRYAKAHPEQVRATKRAWAARHPEKPKLDYERNKERIKAKVLTYKRAHPECTRRYYQKHRQQIIDKAVEYGKRNPHKKLHDTQRRRALKRKTRVENCSAKIKMLRLLPLCSYCFRLTDSPTIDHVVPLARGGEHRPNNLVAACITCNISKGYKLLSEWIPNELEEAA